ncbi:hypothetical protein D7322_28210 [Sphingobacterium puteale]|uniref:Uncharacterized protein n=1 Tax=Sphingobacterium puteale TaxID=2420510 RepID=A0A420VPJ3_9SPHI|nr:hypothetical protein [Sphingobacterium puteale]RKO68249.1 hypothetical protein D7322_28210 [Sphingobacterium puteale]
MKRFIIIAFYVIFFQYCFAQSITDIGRVYINQKNGEYSTFLKEDTQVDSVIIVYKDRLPVSLRFYYLDSVKRAVEDFYYLDFPGDRYLLNLAFGKLNIPECPTVTLILPPYRKEILKKRKVDTHAKFYRDSVRYEAIITEVESDPSVREPTMVTFSANYYQGSKKLQQDFSAFMETLGKSKIPKNGSVFLFQGLVKEDGSLGNVKTIIGDNSIYGDLLKKWLVNLGKPWKSATQGGRHVKSNIDIFVEVKGEHAQISTCGYNRNPRSYKKTN